MPDILTQVLAFEGLPWVVLSAFVAGIVRGFSGFGTALIYLPVAAQFMPPLWTMITLAALDVIGPTPNLPKALRTAHKRDLGRMLAAMLLLMPVGLMVLSAVDPSVFRYAVSIIGLGMLAVLIGGLRYRGTVTPPMVYGIGGAGGFLGGACGMPGPPVIMFYMASPHGPAVVRSNTMIYLFGYDIMLLVVLAISSQLDLLPLVLGFCLAIPALAGNLLGAAIFQPDREKLYRVVAYGVIAASAISGLPFITSGAH